MGKEFINQTFENKLATNKNLFIPYIMAGDGGLDKLEETILFLQNCGVSAIEVGIPFSDPVADGPTIQAAGQRALEQGTTLSGVFKTLENFKEKRNIPIILMSYINLIYVYGIDKFAKRCRDVGVHGVIIPDLPLEEEAMIAQVLQEYSIAHVRLAALTSPSDRIEKIAQHSEGFLYAVSVTGTTGARSTYDINIQQYLQRLKETSDVPVLAGFGISTSEQAHMLSSHCDGVIVGSKIVELLHEGKRDDVKQLIKKSL